LSEKGKKQDETQFAGYLAKKTNCRSFITYLARLTLLDTGKRCGQNLWNSPPQKISEQMKTQITEIKAARHTEHENILCLQITRRQEV